MLMRSSWYLVRKRLVLQVGAAVAMCLPLSGAPVGAKSPIGPNEGIPCVAAENARSVIGRVADVFGRVHSVDPKRSLVLLRFGDEIPTDFSIVVFRKYCDSFSGDVEKMYIGKLVKVRGTVTTYAGNPQIYATSSQQLKVLQEAPKVVAPPGRVSAPESSVVTVASYNILNLFDDVDDPYHNDDATPPKSRKQLEQIAEEIREIDADVLALQEVETRGYLRRFVDVFLPDMGYSEIVHLEGNDLRGIDVCLLSRFPIGKVTSHRHLSFPDDKGTTRRFNRDLLRVQIVPDNARSFEVWVVHLKSSYDGKAYAEPIRIAEARMVRRLLDDRLEDDPSARILVCGDFNDTRDSRALKTIIGTGTHALRAFSDDIPEPMQVTYNKKPYRSMIDFILASPAMAGRFVSGSYVIRPGTVATTGSDHNPVIAKFRLAN